MINLCDVGKITVPEMKNSSYSIGAGNKNFTTEIPYSTEFNCSYSWEYNNIIWYLKNSTLDIKESPLPDYMIFSED